MMIGFHPVLKLSFLEPTPSTNRIKFWNNWLNESSSVSSTQNNNTKQYNQYALFLSPVFLKQSWPVSEALVNELELTPLFCWTSLSNKIRRCSGVRPHESPIRLRQWLWTFHLKVDEIVWVIQKENVTQIKVTHLHERHFSHVLKKPKPSGRWQKWHAERRMLNIRNPKRLYVWSFLQFRSEKCSNGIW